MLLPVFFNALREGKHPASKAWFLLSSIVAPLLVLNACSSAHVSAVKSVKVGNLLMTTAGISGEWTQHHRPPPKEAEYFIMNFPRVNKHMRVYSVLVTAWLKKPSDKASQIPDETIRLTGSEYNSKLSNGRLGSVDLSCGASVEYRPDGWGKRNCSISGYITQRNHFYSEWYGPANPKFIVITGHEVLAFIDSAIRHETVQQEHT